MSPAWKDVRPMDHVLLVSVTPVMREPVGTPFWTQVLTINKTVPAEALAKALKLRATKMACARLPDLFVSTEQVNTDLEAIRASLPPIDISTRDELGPGQYREPPIGRQCRNYELLEIRPR